MSFTLNFSKSAIQVVGQYYQLLRLGKAGYRAIMQNLVQIADHLSDAVANMEDGKLFEIISEGHGQSLPLVAFKLQEEKPYDGACVSSSLPDAR